MYDCIQKNNPEVLIKADANKADANKADANKADAEAAVY